MHPTLWMTAVPAIAGDTIMPAQKMHKIWGSHALCWRYGCCTCSCGDMLCTRRGGACKPCHTISSEWRTSMSSSRRAQADHFAFKCACISPQSVACNQADQHFPVLSCYFSCFQGAKGVGCVRVLVVRQKAFRAQFEAEADAESPANALIVSTANAPSF